jgi:hypothetical protein
MVEYCDDGIIATNCKQRLTDMFSIYYRDSGGSLSLPIGLNWGQRVVPLLAFG